MYKYKDNSRNSTKMRRNIIQVHANAVTEFIVLKSDHRRLDAVDTTRTINRTTGVTY